MYASVMSWPISHLLETSTSSLSSGSSWRDIVRLQRLLDDTSIIGFAVIGLSRLRGSDFLTEFRSFFVPMQNTFFRNKWGMVHRTTHLMERTNRFQATIFYGFHVSDAESQ